jgi:hypothetical protein
MRSAMRPARRITGWNSAATIAAAMNESTAVLCDWTSAPMPPTIATYTP